MILCREFFILLSINEIPSPTCLTPLISSPQCSNKQVAFCILQESSEPLEHPTHVPHIWFQARIVVFCKVNGARFFSAGLCSTAGLRISRRRGHSYSHCLRGPEQKKTCCLCSDFRAMLTLQGTLCWGSVWVKNWALACQRIPGAGMEPLGA